MHIAHEWCCISRTMIGSLRMQGDICPGVKIFQTTPDGDQVLCWITWSIKDSCEKELHEQVTSYKQRSVIVGGVCGSVGVMVNNTATDMYR